MKKPKVLVFDDKKINRDAAEAQLKDCELTVVGTYDEARKLLEYKCDYQKARGIFKKKYGEKKSFEGTEAEQAEMRKYGQEANEMSTTYPDFDIVLVDLFVPASGFNGTYSGELVGKEMPVGIFIALLAAQNKVKNIAVTTDVNHHRHPASTCLDDLGEVLIKEGKISFFHMDGARFDPSDLSKPLEYGEYLKKENVAIEAKYWRRVINCFLKEEVNQLPSF